MFALTNQPVKFTNFNARSELNGDKRRPAADINCTALLPNSILNDFAPGLLLAMYEPPKNPDIVEQADPDAATALRYPQMGLPLDWELVQENRTLVIDFGLGGDSNLTLPECRVHKFKLTPQNGGSVLVGFQISAHPDEKQAGWLYEHQQTDITISLEAPKEDEQQADLLKAGKAKGGNKKTTKAEAEAAFGKAAEEPDDAKKLLNPAVAWPFPTGSENPGTKVEPVVE